MKYIFIVGAPGSKWSSVAKNIYYSSSIDRTDDIASRNYNHSLVNHCGAYWDPGMEFGQEFDRIDQFSRTHNELEFDKPFSGSGVRIIKSHVLSNHIDYLKKAWPDCPVVLVHRPDDACLGWWVRAGGFDIAYPDYTPYYKNHAVMADKITEQNQGIVAAKDAYVGHAVANNHDLATVLGIAIPPTEYVQNYAVSDISVRVI